MRGDCHSKVSPDHDDEISLPTHPPTYTALHSEATCQMDLSYRGSLLYKKFDDFDIVRLTPRLTWIKFQCIISKILMNDIFNIFSEYCIHVNASGLN